MITQRSASGTTKSARPSQDPSTVTRYALIESPVGELLLAVDGAGRLTRLHFPEDRRALAARADWVREEAALEEPRRQLEAYFAGELRDFELELAPRGTPFQLQVWSALRTIPYGTTASYGEIARAVGTPTAARAVGGANNRNPIAIVVPCHRVIGAGGALTGYGGGLPRKRWLLALEAGTPALV
jgi:methylated-DNA-[protein]-cysteine S-methyltransferase